MLMTAGAATCTHVIRRQVLNVSRDDYTLTDATDVILTGCSASLTTLSHLPTKNLLEKTDGCFAPPLEEGRCSDPSVISWCGSLLLSFSADVRFAGDVIAFEGGWHRHIHQLRFRCRIYAEDQSKHTRELPVRNVTTSRREEDQ